MHSDKLALREALIMKLKRIEILMKPWGRWLICLCLATSVLANPPTDLRNVIDRFGTPNQHREFDKYGNQRFNPLLDNGAWHGFLLPDKPAGYGAFTGPLIIAEEYPGIKSSLVRCILNFCAITSGGIETGITTKMVLSNTVP